MINPRHRTVPRPRIIEMLLFLGWAHELAAGRRQAAEPQASEALEYLLRLGLGANQGADGEQKFDPVEVYQFVTYAGLAGRFHLWTERFIPARRAHFHQLASLTESNPAPRFLLRFSRILSLRDIPEGAKLRLTMPVPIASSYVHDRNIAPAPQTRAKVRDTCLDIQITAPACRPVTLAAEFAFTATPPRPDPQPLSDADRALYLRPSEGFIRVTPRIENLAATLAGGATGPQEEAAKFHDFMTDDLMHGMIRYSDIQGAAGDWVLDNGWHDCLLGAALLIALCRARGIPARLIGGYFLYELYPTNHHWAEIWIDGAGWLPYDFAGWSLSEAGRDPQWRDVFAGRCNPRMVTEIFPLQFTGPMSVKLPPEWHMLTSHYPNGYECRYGDALSGAMTYQDRVEFLAVKK